MKTANPYLNFAGNTEEAFEFYRSVFGGEFLQVLRYKDMEGMGATGEDLEKIAHIALRLSENDILMGTDALESMGQSLTVGNNFSIALDPESSEEADRLFDALSSGGDAQMPLQETEWAEKFGALTDRFGVQWMVNYGGSKE